MRKTMFQLKPTFQDLMPDPFFSHRLSVQTDKPNLFAASPMLMYSLFIFSTHFDFYNHENMYFEYSA